MKKTGKRVIVAGLGNIGSYLVPIIARIPQVRGLILIDPDRYERKNLKNQAIGPEDAGRPKAEVQARKVRNMNPALFVQAIREEIQNLPLGLLRADCLLCCFDNDAARQYASEVCHRLGMVCIDSGVHGAEGYSLARVTVYLPGPEMPCVNCAWDQSRYRNLSHSYPCGGGAAPTEATAALGAVAASLQATECLKWLTGRTDLLAGGRQLTYDTNHHAHSVSRLVRNPDCPFDHEPWPCKKVNREPVQMSLRQAMALSNRRSREGTSLSLLFGRPFYRGAFLCHRCGTAGEFFSISSRLPKPFCRRCGVQVRNGLEKLELVPRLRADELDPSVLDLSLHEFGIRRHEVFTVSSGSSNRVYLELAGANHKGRGKHGTRSKG